MSIFLVVVAVLFYFVWLSEDIPALLTGEVPQCYRRPRHLPTSSMCWTWPGSCWLMS